MRTVRLYECKDCGDTFAIGRRCVHYVKGVVGHTTFNVIGVVEIPDIVEKITYRDRVIQAVSAGKFKGADMRFISHIL